MSSLIERRNARKAEAEALANKFNTLTEESKKLENERAQVHADFTVKSAQYAELEQMVKEAAITDVCSVNSSNEG
tara:strand:- start:2205 stop:2429 length:225 start_codon:yes stop_codon:yes gene_type:complete